jgi:hypothetical protein
MEVGHGVEGIVAVHDEAWIRCLDIGRRVVPGIHEFLSVRMLEREHCTKRSQSPRLHQLRQVKKKIYGRGGGI